MDALCLPLLVGLAFTLQATLGRAGRVAGVGAFGRMGGVGGPGVTGGADVVRGLEEVGVPGRMGGLERSCPPTGVEGRSWHPALGFRAQGETSGTALLDLILDALHLHGGGPNPPRFGDGSRELVARDPGTRRRGKVKFLNHLTGPLRFSPECSRYFHRILHGTRECGHPAYYRRCARLLTRLASSPPCVARP